MPVKRADSPASGARCVGRRFRDEPDTNGLALKAVAALQRELPVKNIALRAEHCEQPTP